MRTASVSAVAAFRTRTPMSMRTAVRATASRPKGEIDQQARSGSGWYAWLARTGLVAKGISYGIVGVLAIEVATGNGGSATSRQGALDTLAHSVFGKLVLVLLAIGFAAYAIWRFVQAVAEKDEDGG